MILEKRNCPITLQIKSTGDPLTSFTFRNVLELLFIVQSQYLHRVVHVSKKTKAGKLKELLSRVSLYTLYPCHPPKIWLGMFKVVNGTLKHHGSYNLNLHLMLTSLQSL